MRHCAAELKQSVVMRVLNRPSFVRPTSWQEETKMESPTDEIRAIRHELAVRFGNDMAKIVADLKRQQRESGLTYIRLPKRQPRAFEQDPRSAEARQAGRS